MAPGPAGWLGEGTVAAHGDTGQGGRAVVRGEGCDRSKCRGGPTFGSNHAKRDKGSWRLQLGNQRKLRCATDRASVHKHANDATFGIASYYPGIRSLAFRMLASTMERLDGVG